MEALLSRYRNLSVLVVVVVAQLLYLAYQVKTNRDERLIRVWAVSAVTPMAGMVEDVRHNTIGFLQDYFILLDVREQNRKLKSVNDKLRMENVYYRNQLNTAEHARALILFQAQSPSKSIAARVIGNSTVVTAKAVFIDRGSTSGVEQGMAVVTPDGIVGKVVAVYPLVSQVLLVTDPTFKVGVESQKGHVHGVLDCSGKCKVEEIPNEDKVGIGEWFFTSGEDRIFPKGFPVGTVLSAGPGQGTKDINVSLSGAPGGVEEILVLLKGVHQAIPTGPPEETASAALPPPPKESGNDAGETAKPQTEADKVQQKYQDIGKTEGHVYGAVGSGVPDFNAKPGAAAKPTQGEASASASGPANNSGSPPTNTASPAEKTASAATENAPSSKTPGMLGAKPVVKPAAPKPAIDTEPVLPLGAPRHKAVAPDGRADKAPAPMRSGPPAQ